MPLLAGRVNVGKSGAMGKGSRAPAAPTLKTANPDESVRKTFKRGNGFTSKKGDAPRIANPFGRGA